MQEIITNSKILWSYPQIQMSAGVLVSAVMIILMLCYMHERGLDERN